MKGNIIEVRRIQMQNNARNVIWRDKPIILTNYEIELSASLVVISRTAYVLRSSLCLLCNIYCFICLFTTQLICWCFSNRSHIAKKDVQHPCRYRLSVHRYIYMKKRERGKEWEKHCFLIYVACILHIYIHIINLY